jgi:hypothetical protein
MFINPYLPLSNIREKLGNYLKARFETELETGVLKGYLELDISELNNPDIQVLFNEARRFFRDHDHERSFLRKYLGMFNTMTSIVAQIATLASTTNRKTWPILSLLLIMPIAEKLSEFAPWERDHSERGIFSFSLALRVANDQLGSGLRPTLN